MIKKRTTIALFLALFLVLSWLPACSRSSENVPNPSKSSSEKTPEKTTSPSAVEGDEKSDKEVVYPLTTGYTFTCWWPFENDLATKMKTLADNEYFKFVEKLTGVSIEFIHPTQGGEGESYNLMLVSGIYDDFIRTIGTYHTRGLDDAVESEIIYDLKDYLDYLPNYNKVRTELPEREKQSITDKGYIAGLSMLITEPQTFVNGLMVRKDWLDKLNLEVPVTLAEFDNMLVQFKDNIPTASNGPLWMNNSGNAGMYDSFGIGFISRSPVVFRDGKVRVSVLEDGFREYVETMADWYNRGLIWQDFLSDSGIIPFFNSQAKVANGELGVIYDCFVYVDIYNQIGVGDDFKIIPIPNPVKNAGEKLHTGMYTNYAQQGMLGITTQCEDIPLACKYWDYGYSDDGMIRANYGEEGVTMEFGNDGMPRYTEFATKNPDGLTFYHVQNMYMIQNAPFYRVGARELAGISDDERACEPAWTDNKDSAYSLPPVSLTSDEGLRRADILGDVNTYISENLVQFINGNKAMSEFDGFIDQIKSMGIEEICDIYEDAIVRYNNRGK